MNTVDLTVNKRSVRKPVEPRTSLADMVRDTLDLTGTHLGCEHGVCGACTILIDDIPARSCITFAVTCDGAEVTTIEGLDEDEITTELRAAFTREHALQCGYCTPGMLISARDLVLRLPYPDERAIRVGMSGNLCRCTGYVGIVRAVKSVITERRERNILPIGKGGRTALGPVGSGHSMLTSQRPLASASVSVAETMVKSPPLSIPDFTPSTVMQQSFTVKHPRDKVFSVFHDIAVIASCLPGAMLTGTPRPERIEGYIKVKIGPISANFNGAARIERNEEDFSGRIIGVGHDHRSRSTTQGEIGYRLLPENDGTATRVELSIGYNLTGMLAQIGRSGLVRDLSARIVGDFEKNLDQYLAGNSALQSTSPAALSGVSLVFGVLRDRIVRIFLRIKDV